MLRTASITLLLGLLAFASGCSDSPSSAPSGEFTALAYNVAGLPQEVSQENPEEHIPLISPLINAYDLVLTQEDFDWWQPELDELDFANYHTRLRAQTDFPYQSEAHPGPEAVGLDWRTVRPTLFVGDGLGLLSRFPFDELRRVPWGSCATAAADCLAMKGFAMARVELTPSVTVDVYNLHAEAGGEPDDNRARADGFDQLAAYIQRNSKNHAVILGGDTNLHTEPESDDADDREDARVWREFLQRTNLVDVCVFLECADNTRIDKFAFRSASALALEPLSWQFLAEMFVDAARESLSDHDPLLVEWRWSAPDR
jgi:endonuclease/exonuclease/phosphatase (EEP) superfamily protein YafD